MLYMFNLNTTTIASNATQF